MRRDPNSRPEKFKDLMSLHAGERRGILIMAAILVLLTLGVAYMNFGYQPPETDLAPLRKEMEEWVAMRNMATNADSAVVAEPFPFDPNTIERAEWLALGLTNKQVDGVERYVSKGGRFRTKKDLAKMYSIRPEQYIRLEPFILLPDSVARKEYPKREPFPRTAYEARPEPGERKQWTQREPLRKVEMNTADTTELVALPGIGPSFARGIVKYRTGLGGYFSLDQLSEVFVLRDKPEAVARIKELLVLDPDAIHRIPINTCTVEELAAHPYARWKVAKPLIAYRTQHGAFKSVDGIKGCVMVTDSVFMRLAPYLTVDQ